MNPVLHRDLSARLARDYAFIEKQGWLRGGKCPHCQKKELFAKAAAPWVLRCNRLNNCGAEFHVKELYPELFDDWSARFEKTPQNPNAAADAYLRDGRGFDLDRIRGWYTQESFYDSKLRIGSATVRFPIGGETWWERLIDRPQRFGKRKANFRGEYSGIVWSPPGVPANENFIWIVEGIFDAIAMHHHGIYAVAAMSSVNYPYIYLEAVAEQCVANNKPRPHLIWALDGDKAGRTFARRGAERATLAGWTCRAATIPQRGKDKSDWNDLHQRDRLTAEHIDEWLYEGDLLLSKSAAEKAMLMYKHHGTASFEFDFSSRLYWFKFDSDRYNKAVETLTVIHGASKNSEEIQNLARAESGNVSEIANCNPTALYYQAHALTDESWYYLRVEFPHGGGAVKNTFTGAQLSSASEFKKRLLAIAPGAVFTGNSHQLDRFLKTQLYNIKTVQTIDFIGYAKEYGCYVYSDVAVKDGQAVGINDEDFFDLGKLSIKSLSQSVALQINRDLSEFSAEWIALLYRCFGVKGLVALAYWFGSLFAEQIRAEHKSFPFLEVIGDPGAGKTTLIEFLWKLAGRPDYEGFDPAKSTLAARARNFSQVGNLPVVLIESDRGGGEDNIKQKTFDWDELKPLYNGRSVRSRGVKNGGNETYEPPFRGTIVISQNGAVEASDAVLQRIVHLRFDLSEHSPETRSIAAKLERMEMESTSGFLLRAIRAESAVMKAMIEKTPAYEAQLLDRPGIKNVRIAKNHAQLMALVDVLDETIPLSAEMRTATLKYIGEMAAQRQQAINAEHPTLQNFWEVYEYLNGIDSDPKLNHSRDPGLIAISLPHFVSVAADRRQQIPLMSDLKRLLKTSRTHKFVGVRSVNSAINAKYNTHKDHTYPEKPETVKAWVFQA